MLALVLLATAAPVVPPLTPAEQVALRSREVVVHAAVTDQQVESTGFVASTASPARMWAAVLDFAARVAENDTLVAITEYARAGVDDWSLRFEMSVFGFDAAFHNRFRRDGGAVTYTLDPSRPNDLAVCDGWYVVEPRDGGSLFVYRAVTRSETWAPAWVWRWIATDSMEQVMADIRARAER